MNTPNGAVGRILHLPPLAGLLTFGPPTLQLPNSLEDVDPSDYSFHRAPLLHLHLFLLLHSHHDGNIGMNTGSYIGSSTSFHGVTDQQRRRWKRGEGQFRIFSIRIQLGVDRVAILLPTRTTTSSRTTATTTNRRRTYRHIYILPRSSSNTSGCRCWYRLLGLSGGVDIDMASTTSLSLKSGSVSTRGVEGL